MKNIIIFSSAILLFASCKTEEKKEATFNLDAAKAAITKSNKTLVSNIRHHFICGTYHIQDKK